MANHDAQPGRPEVVLPDQGAWISGPCIDPGTIEYVAAEDIEAGDVLLLEDGRQAEVTDVRLGYYHF